MFWAGVLLGEYDLICYLNARNPNELRSSLNKIRKGIGRYVQHYELMLADRVLYWNLVSEASYSHLRAAV